MKRAASEPRLLTGNQGPFADACVNAVGKPLVRVKALHPELVVTDIIAAHLLRPDAPRRYIVAAPTGTLGRVNKRAEDLVRKIRDLPHLNTKLASMSATQRPLKVVSPDDRDWRADPSGFVIVADNVWSLLERLLFSGPTDTWGQQSLLAGLLGHDSVWIVPDSDLAKQAVATLKSCAAEHSTGPRPMRLWTVSASEENPDITFGPEDHAQHDKLLRARRKITLHMSDTAANARAKMTKQVNDLDDGLVLCSVVSPEEAERIFQRVKCGEKLLVAGTRRRGEQAEMDEKIAAMNAGSGKRVIVGTSATAFGPLLDVDVLVSDVASPDEMLHRLRKVNRLGQRLGDVHVYAYEKSAKDPYKANLAVLRSLPVSKGGQLDASVENLMTLSSEHQGALRMTTEVLDSLSLTNFDHRPSVADLVFGSSQGMPNRTCLVVRDEVDLFMDLVGYPWTHEKEERIGRHIQACIDLCPVSPHEVLSVPAYQLERRLRTDYESGRWFPAAIMSNGHVVAFSREKTDHTYLGNLIRRRGMQLADKLCLVSSDARLVRKDGIFASSYHAMGDTALDASVDHYVKVIVEKNGSWSLSPLGAWLSQRRKPRDERVYEARGKSPYEAARKYIEKNLDGWRLRGLVELQRSHDDEPFFFGVIVPGDADVSSSFGSLEKQTLKEHTDLVIAWTDRLTYCLGLDDEMREDFHLAASAHDLGKDDPAWQLAIGNDAYPDTVLAKSGKRTFRLNVVGWYAHELGSLMKARGQGLSDLVLHLVASHHGRARPTFRRNQFDPKISTAATEDEVFEAARRFGRLQRQFGHWGLAWLEAVMRGGDAIASMRSVSDPLPEEEDA